MLEHFSLRTQPYPLKIVPQDHQMNKFLDRCYAANANKQGHYQGLFPSSLFFAAFALPSDSSPIEGVFTQATNCVSFLALLPPLLSTLFLEHCGRIYF